MQRVDPGSSDQHAKSPVFKKDDKTNVENYRPISLISAVGKTSEKVVYKRIHNFILANQIITPFQSGFVPGDSTVNQLTDMYVTHFVGPWTKAKKSEWYFVI